MMKREAGRRTQSGFEIVLNIYLNLLDEAEGRLALDPDSVEALEEVAERRKGIGNLMRGCPELWPTHPDLCWQYLDMPPRSAMH